MIEYTKAKNDISLEEGHTIFKSSFPLDIQKAQEEKMVEGSYLFKYVCVIESKVQLQFFKMTKPYQRNECLILLHISSIYNFRR